MSIGGISNSNLDNMIHQYGLTASAGNGVKSLGYDSNTSISQMDQASFLDYFERAKGTRTDLVDIEALSREYSTGKPGASNLQDAFLKYDVITHVGNTNISETAWFRNDFPFEKFFDNGVTADCLNNWKPTGPNPPQSDPSVQRGLSSIGFGKMVVNIPESLQEKMDADENYAQEIMKKIQKWKEDYDKWDNATALSLGMNVADNQFSKRYILNLDEEGNVKQYAVIGGGGHITGPTEEEQRQFEEAQRIKRKKQEEQEIENKERNRKAAEEKQRLEAEYRRASIETALIYDQLF